MEPQQKQSRAGAVTAVVSLAALCVFWAVYFAYSHRAKPKKPRTAAELVEELKTIKPLEGAQQVGIGSLNPPPVAHFVTVIANYTSDSSCQAIAEHYKKEFALRGFGYKIRDDEKQDSEAMSFCGHETHGSFSCISGVRGQHYLISLRWPEYTWVAC
jgi:hypothetical protein